MTFLFVDELNNELAEISYYSRSYFFMLCLTDVLSTRDIYKECCFQIDA